MARKGIRTLLWLARAGVAALVVVVVVGLAAPAAQAWNESGHRIIAAAAARQMEPELQAMVLAALRAHPRYDRDLAAYRPGKLAELSELEWLMGQAAQWPDRIRRFNNEPFYRRKGLVEKFHRGRWHYINLPAYLTPEDQSLGINDPTTAIDTDNPGDVLEALGFLREQLRDPTVSLENKGLWISWALHLIADVHQPLHTTAMFARKRWPKGDRGGNEVKIAGSGKKGRLDSLHYFWDSAISNVRAPADINRLMAVLAEQTLPSVQPDEASPVMWVREGNAVANDWVYGPLRAQLLQSSVVTINTQYTQRTHATALQQGAVAARRTALWLQAVLK